MKIYGHAHSRSTRAVWAAEEVGAEYDYEHVDLETGAGRRPPYALLNPSGKVPTLTEGSLVLSESAAICNYLADRFPVAGLRPAADSPERALCDQWSYFCCAELEQPLWTIAKHKMVYPEKLRVPAIIDVAKSEFASAVRVLDIGLGEREFIVGERFSVADLLLAHTLLWAKTAKLPLGSARIEQYEARMLGRAALARAVLREKAAVPTA